MLPGTLSIRPRISSLGSVAGLCMLIYLTSDPIIGFCVSKLKISLKTNSSRFCLRITFFASRSSLRLKVALLSLSRLIYKPVSSYICLPNLLFPNMLTIFAGTFRYNFSLKIWIEWIIGFAEPIFIKISFKVTREIIQFCNSSFHM